jgi:hypothetical protein
MRSHAHISLCDESWNLYYDYIDFNILSSVSTFTDLIFNIFPLKDYAKEKIESNMYKIIDNNLNNPIYFKSEDLVYLWLICSDCKLISLN